MADHAVYVKEAHLYGFVKEVFERAGLSGEDAAFHARALVDTDLWGVSSHGTMRVPAYFYRMISGAIRVKPDVRTIRGEAGLEVMDGDHGAGIVVGRAAMRRAIEKARQYHIAAVGVVNSNHFGASAIYARMAAEEGMVGISMTNVMPLVTAPGACRPVVGNNPLAVAIPTYGDFPFCLDMAMSKVAGGKLTLAIKRGEKIPKDWATDREGHATDDPQKAFDGFLLPMGDHKGLGLAYMVDILSGVITGGVFAHQMKSMYANPEDPSLTGHFFIAMDLDAIIGRDALKERMQEYYNRLKATPMWQAGAEMYLPGELEYKTSLRLKETGIPVPQKTYEELLAIREKFGIAAVLPENKESL